jgi:hypothetical protein
MMQSRFVPPGLFGHGEAQRGNLRRSYFSRCKRFTKYLRCGNRCLRSRFPTWLLPSIPLIKTS